MYDIGGKYIRHPDGNMKFFAGLQNSADVFQNDAAAFICRVKEQDIDSLCRSNSGFDQHGHLPAEHGYFMV